MDDKILTKEEQKQLLTEMIEDHMYPFIEKITSFDIFATSLQLNTLKYYQDMIRFRKELTRKISADVLKHLWNEKGLL